MNPTAARTNVAAITALMTGDAGLIDALLDGMDADALSDMWAHAIGMCSAMIEWVARADDRLPSEILARLGLIVAEWGD